MIKTEGGLFWDACICLYPSPNYEKMNLQLSLYLNLKSIPHFPFVFAFAFEPACGRQV